MDKTTTSQGNAVVHVYSSALFLSKLLSDDGLHPRDTTYFQSESFKDETLL